MAEYRLTATDSIVRTADGAFIPADPANCDYAEYLQWVEDGGVADPYVAPPPPVPVPDANARITAGVVAALDVAIAVKTAMQNIPDNFNAQNFAAAKIQLDALTEAFAEMLKAQVDPNAPSKPALELHEAEVEEEAEAEVEEEAEAEVEEEVEEEVEAKPVKPKRKRAARKRR